VAVAAAAAAAVVTVAVLHRAEMAMRRKRLVLVVGHWMGSFAEAYQSETPLFFYLLCFKL
jgi:hypothetical protein